MTLAGKKSNILFPNLDKVTQGKKKKRLRGVKQALASTTIIISTTITTKTMLHTCSPSLWDRYLPSGYYGMLARQRPRFEP
jgi:hypothetical protein